MKTGISWGLALLLAGTASTDVVDAPERHGIANVRYAVTFDATTAPGRLIHVAIDRRTRLAMGVCHLEKTLEEVATYGWVQGDGRMGYPRTSVGDIYESYGRQRWFRSRGRAPQVLRAPLGRRLCVLTLTHRFNRRTQTYRSVRDGWVPILFDLKAVLETGKGLPCPRRDLRGRCIQIVNSSVDLLQSNSQIRVFHDPNIVASYCSFSTTCIRT